MEKRTRREKTEEKESITLLDVTQGIYVLLWAEFIFACACMVLSWFIPFEYCFYILFGVITVLNGIATINLERKLKENEVK